jgi:hypothetical protein
MKRSPFALGARVLCILATALFMACQAPAATLPTAAASKLPAACHSHCVTPFGTFLGVADGVPAYSNCSAKCVDLKPVKADGVYTGIKWQCVEYARRWLLKHKDAVFADVDVAADIWTKIHHLQRVDHKGTIPLQNDPNGSPRPPSVGDLLIYARAYLGTGHVAVITDVDLHSHVIKVAEENYRNRKYPGDYARKIDLIERHHRYWVLDPYVLGWKHATEQRFAGSRLTPAARHSTRR